MCSFYFFSFLCSKYSFYVFLIQVFFTSDPHAKFSDFKDKTIFNADFQIYFQTKDCLKAFEKLIEERCNICSSRSPSFKSIIELNDHLRNEHDRYTCDICVNNLKIFSEERRYYKKSELVKHLDEGDSDRSYTGHPKCEFDGVRFIDKEDLNRHLRRDHYHCHLCDTTKSVVYLATYVDLKKHFGTYHFLCEEGDCKNDELTKVFKTDLDLQVHKAQAHCYSKSKAKSAKTLSLDLFFSSRGSQSTGPNSFASFHHDSSRASQSSRKDLRPGNSSNYNTSYLSSTLGNDTEESLENSFSFDFPPQQIPRAEDFPLLEESVPKASKSNTNSNASKSHQKSKNFSFSWKLSGQALAQRNEEEFPALSNFENPNTSMPSTSSGLSAAQAVKSKSKPSEPVKSLQQPSSSKLNIFNNDYYLPPSLTHSVNHEVNSKCSKKSVNSRPPIPNLHIQDKDFTVKQEDFPALPLRLTCGKKKKRPSNPTQSTDSNSKLAENVNNPSNQFEGIKDIQFSEILNPSFSYIDKVQALNVSSSKKDEQPKGINQPPPGFKEKSNGVITLSLDLNSLAEQVINSDKDQVKEQSYQNHTQEKHAYVRPNDWEERSKVLQEKIDLFLKTREMREKFRNNSKQFQNYRIKAHEYYNRCLDLLGRNKLNQILVDLITLLPDIKKQNELLAEHEKHVNKRNYNLGLNKPATSGEWEIKADRVEFLVCPTCQQVLSKKDGNVHILNHCAFQG